MKVKTIQDFIKEFKHIKDIDKKFYALKMYEKIKEEK